MKKNGPHLRKVWNLTRTVGDFDVSKHCACQQKKKSCWHTQGFETPKIAYLGGQIRKKTTKVVERVHNRWSLVITFLRLCTLRVLFQTLVYPAVAF